MNGAVVKGAGTKVMASKAAGAVKVVQGGGAVAAASTGGKVLAGSSSKLSLGLGLGLGAWGPIMLVGAIAAIGVGVYSYMKRPSGDVEMESAVN